MCLLRINLPNLCPNMNHFDAVDFSECHSEEVKFLLTLSNSSSWSWDLNMFFTKMEKKNSCNEFKCWLSLSGTSQNTLTSEFEMLFEEGCKSINGIPAPYSPGKNIVWSSLPLQQHVTHIYSYIFPRLPKGPNLRPAKAAMATTVEDFRQFSMIAASPRWRRRRSPSPSPPPRWASEVSN